LPARSALLTKRDEKKVVPSRILGGNVAGTVGTHSPCADDPSTTEPRQENLEQLPDCKHLSEHSRGEKSIISKGYLQRKKRKEKHI
jgi:hypothetical protein